MVVDNEVTFAEYLNHIWKCIYMDESLTLGILPSVFLDHVSF